MEKVTLKVPRLKIVCGSVLFCIFFLVLRLSAAEIKIPLPPDAVKVSERSVNFGVLKLTTKTYSSALSLKSIREFYLQQMLRNGWKEKHTDFFVKDKCLISIMFSGKSSLPEKTQFKIITGNLPTADEVIAQRLVKPDKLDFMPVHPKSLQVFHWDFPFGVACSYETESSIKDVVFFYKFAMLGYGWGLVKDSPIAEKITDCPGCKDFDSENKRLKSTGRDNPGGVSLIFRRGNQAICEIKIFKIFSVDSDDLTASVTPKTGILVNYKKYGKIKS